jgi:hypothetical protein
MFRGRKGGTQIAITDYSINTVKFVCWSYDDDAITVT